MERQNVDWHVVSCHEKTFFSDEKYIQKFNLKKNLLGDLLGR